MTHYNPTEAKYNHNTHPITILDIFDLTDEPHYIITIFHDGSPTGQLLSIDELTARELATTIEDTLQYENNHLQVTTTVEATDTIHPSRFTDRVQLRN